MRFFIGILFCIWAGVEGSSSVNGYFDIAKDGAKFKSLFIEGLASQDLSSIYYSVSGMKYLNEAVPKTVDVCKNIIDLSKGTVSIEQSYYASTAFQSLQCKGALNPSITKTVKDCLDDSKCSLSDVMYSVYTFKALGNKGYEKATVIKTTQEFLKKDDSVANLGLVFHICAEVGCGQWAVDRMEDAVIQADEVDGKMLHWEGGLPVTASVLTGILKLAQVENKPSQINQEQSVKIANYLLSRRSVQSVKGGSVLLEALNVLASDKQISPICISMSGNGQIGAESQPINIIVNNIIGLQHPSVSAESVIAQSATRLQDDVVVLSKQKLIQDPKNPTSFTLDLMKVKPDRGLYKLAISAGTGSGSLSVRVSSAIDINNVEVGVGDVDGSSTSRLTAVKYPQRLAQPLEADSLQKIIVKFSLNDKGQTQIVKVHQTFVRIFSKVSGIEVIFVAELDASKVYKMDVDVGSVADKFNHESGLYSIEVFIGDSVISNPICWTLADINLKFPPAVAKEAKSSESIRVMKPEISHMFREPDARPSRIVSDVFTGLCVAPMLLLFILWGKIGINVKNFPFSLSAIGFHLGLGSILGLFVVFWLKLTMFETVRYLLALGLITFICGNRLLKSMAAKRKRV